MPCILRLRTEQKVTSPVDLETPRRSVSYPGEVCASHPIDHAYATSIGRAEKAFAFVVVTDRDWDHPDILALIEDDPVERRSRKLRVSREVLKTIATSRRVRLIEAFDPEALQQPGRYPEVSFAEIAFATETRALIEARV
jgi:hypothetical protein